MDPNELRDVVEEVLNSRRGVIKEILQEALKDWLDQQFAKFGRWSFFGVAALGIAGLTYFILWINGWATTPTR